MVEDMSERKILPPLNKSDRLAAWRERIKVDLAAQVEAGGTLYGYREDGAYIARTRSGDRVITLGARQSA